MVAKPQRDLAAQAVAAVAERAATLEAEAAAQDAAARAEAERLAAFSSDLEAMRSRLAGAKDGEKSPEELEEELRAAEQRLTELAARGEEVLRCGKESAPSKAAVEALRLEWEDLRLKVSGEMKIGWLECGLHRRYSKAIFSLAVCDNNCSG